MAAQAGDLSGTDAAVATFRHVLVEFDAKPVSVAHLDRAILHCDGLGDHIVLQQLERRAVADRHTHPRVRRDEVMHRSGADPERMTGAYRARQAVRLRDRHSFLCQCDAAEGTDRKSTRLNSSHRT